MARIKKYKPPIGGLTSGFGGCDHSKGKDGGIWSAIYFKHMMGNYKAPKYPNRGIMSAPTKAKAAASAAQRLQRIKYCGCDGIWKLYTQTKKDVFHLWWPWTNGKKSTSQPSYQAFMSACLKGRYELNFYPDYCWNGVYSETNDFPFVIAGRDVYLMNVPFLNPAGTDCLVFYYSPANVVFGSVPFTVVSPGILKIQSPVMQMGQTVRWMVYSYMGL